MSEKEIQRQIDKMNEEARAERRYWNDIYRDGMRIIREAAQKKEKI